MYLLCMGHHHTKEHGAQKNSGALFDVMARQYESIDYVLSIWYNVDASTTYK